MRNLLRHVLRASREVRSWPSYRHTHRTPEDWPVLPDGIEGVIYHNVAPGAWPETEPCFVCGEPVDDPTGACWFIPGRGMAHGTCYELEGA